MFEECGLNPLILERRFGSPIKTIIRREGLLHVFDDGAVKQVGPITKDGDVLPFPLLPEASPVSCSSRICSKLVKAPTDGFPEFEEVYERLTGTKSLCEGRTLFASVWYAPLYALAERELGAHSSAFSTKLALEALGPNEKYFELVRRGLKYAKLALVVKDREAERLMSASEARLLMRFKELFTWKAEGTSPTKAFFPYFEVERLGDALVVHWTKPKEDVKVAAKDKPLWFLSALTGLPKPPDKAEDVADMLYLAMTRRNASSVHLKFSLPLISGVIKFGVEIGIVSADSAPIGSKRFLSVIGNLGCKHLVTASLGPCGAPKWSCDGKEWSEPELADSEVLFGECPRSGRLSVCGEEVFYWQVLRAFYGGKLEEGRA